MALNERMAIDSMALNHRTPELLELKVARIFYYLGMAFVAAGAIRPLGGLNLSDWLFFGSVGVTAWTVLLGRVRFDLALPGVFVYGFAVFTVGGLLCLPVALHPIESAGALLRFVYIVLVWFALGAIVLRNRRQVEIAIGAWILSAAGSGLAAVAQVKWGSLLFASFTTVPHWSEGALSFDGRQIGLTGHPNDLGSASAIVFAVAVLFVVSPIRSRVERLLFTALLGLVLAGVGLSGSITAMGVTIASAVVALATAGLRPKSLIVIIGIALFTTFVLVQINQQGVSSVLSPADRLSITLGLQGAADASGPGRLNLDIIAWNEIVHNPIYGVGLDPKSIEQVLGGAGVHNMFLLVWVGVGLFGFIGLLIMTSSLAASCVQEIRLSAPAAERTLVVALSTSYVGFVAVSMAQPVIYIRHGWVPAALIVALRAIRIRRERSSLDLGPALEQTGRYQPNVPRVSSPASHSFGQ